MFGKNRKYKQVAQIEVENISHLVKFWLDNIKHYLSSSKDKHLNAISFDTKTLLADFISLYELNRAAFNRVDNSQVTIRSKTIILSPLKKFRWQISCIDSQVNGTGVSRHNVGPTELGMSILGMFAVANFRRVIDPDILMAICYYYDP